MDTLLKLADHGQSYWLDNLTRNKIQSGELHRRAYQEGLRGITSNPAIFGKAIAASDLYDRQIEEAVAAGRTVPQIYEALTTTDVRDACDILHPVYDVSEGRDGFVSLEVSPHLAHDTEATRAEARRLWHAVDRPNLLIKIPGTRAGLPAIEACLFEGINVNVTLLFSIPAYQSVAWAYIRALERRLAAGLPIERIASVASFFLSRIDVLVDPLLAQRIRPGAVHGASPVAERLLGRAAVANARLAYQRFKTIIAAERWRWLEAKGARVQRLLWASTSTKNPRYRDVMYVEPLIGPHTVNTMPDETIAAFADHGAVPDTDSVEEEIEEAEQVMRDLRRIGIDFGRVAGQLLNEGIQKFIDPYDASLAILAEKARKLARRDVARPLEQMAQKLRRTIIRMTTEAGSGHPTSSMSAAEIMATLFFHELRWDPTAPEARNVDHFVLSKGHAAPALWAVLYEAGAIAEDPMTLRRIDSTLEGHPTPRNPWVKVATGSLGQGLAAACGIVLADRLDGIDGRVYCLLGDGECSEGSVWEAAQFAALNKLSGLVAIVDVNGLGQSGPAPYDHDLSVFEQRFEAYGWQTIQVDGHKVTDLLDAFEQARAGGPTAILARTEKGKGVSFLEGKGGFHGKPLDQEQARKALEEIVEVDQRLRVEPRRVAGPDRPPSVEGAAPIEVSYRPGELVATRAAYGAALKKLGSSFRDLVVLDGDVKNSTYTEHFERAYPDRFFQGHIAEQNLTGVALGLAAMGKRPHVSSFACFLTRAFDFIRMAGHSAPKHLVFNGSHAGVSIGEDGPSQMGLEDLAMFRAVAGSTVLYPADAVSAERLTEAAMQTEGIVYIRTTRAKTPVLYGDDEPFPVGGAKVLRESAGDRLTVVAAGITLHEALAAQEKLQRQGIPLRVIDAYSVKPLDAETLRRAARQTGGIVVVEDHWRAGGLGEAVASALAGIGIAFRHLAVDGEPRSGKPSEMLDRHGISGHAIETAVREMLGAERRAAPRWRVYG
ncbi:transaldolase [Sulfurifustis variabilis]|uniref:Transaldolase n=1 Tax=Sulfurifustis variabilis TaxID=1675686 RepID=A0A1C7AEY5_9GAMM|nr:transketolase [Sulfurifustis variabilis]BAU49760.1 transaldolase [Sulfurifustis variabilis]